MSAFRGEVKGTTPPTSLGSPELWVVSYHVARTLEQPVENPAFQETKASSLQLWGGAILAAAPPASVKPSDEMAPSGNSSIIASSETLSQNHPAEPLTNPWFAKSGNNDAAVSVS